MLFKRGDKVKVVSIIHTERAYGTNPTMLNMADGIKTFTVKSADLGTVMLNGYYFHPDDIRPEHYNEKEEERDPQIFHFDTSHLDIGKEV